MVDVLLDVEAWTDGVRAEAVAVAKELDERCGLVALEVGEVMEELLLSGERFVGRWSWGWMDVWGGNCRLGMLKSSI